MLQIFSSMPDRRECTVYHMDVGTALCSASISNDSCDVTFVDQEKGLFSLADGEGLGKHAEFASVLATRRMERCLEEAWSDTRGWYWPMSWGKEPNHVDHPLTKSILIYARKVTHDYLKEFKKRHSE